jgi:hypothetical protein
MFELEAVFGHVFQVDATVQLERRWGIHYVCMADEGDAAEIEAAPRFIDHHCRPRIALKVLAFAFDGAWE